MHKDHRRRCIYDATLLDARIAKPVAPEDCGGVPGYEDKVTVASGGQASYHDTHASRMVRRLGPDLFDVASAREAFDCSRRRARPRPVASRTA
jgi:hypothetical protein